MNNWKICLGEENCVPTGDGDWPDGYYEFTNLGPGTYNLTEVLQTGWEQTIAPDSVTVISGKDISDLNFGNRGALKICGTKYNDADKSGTLTDGDLAIKGWTIILSGDRNDSIVTDEEGYYCFENLEPGNYTVSEEERDGWTATSTSSIAFTGMISDQTVNFFNYPYPVLGITKVSDVSSFINPGNTVTYTITITNTGIGAAIDFLVEDVLPAGFNYVDGSSNITGATGSGPTLSDNTLAWTIERLDPNSSFAITNRVLTDSDILAGIYINTASVMEESDDCEVRVEVPIVLGEEVEKKLPEKVGKILGAAITKTGGSIVFVLLLSFLIASICYLIYLKERSKKNKENCDI